jgi:hypothetical protein
MRKNWVVKKSAAGKSLILKGHLCHQKHGQIQTQVKEGKVVL